MKEPSESLWVDYLAKGESVVSKFNFSGYDIATTTERVICLKKFPKSFSEARYSDIHSLGHHTPLNWNRLVRGILFLVVSGYLYTISPLRGKTVLTDFLGEITENYLSELSSLPLDNIIIGVIGLLGVYGIWNLIKFIKSTTGVLKITLNDKGPIKIATPLTSDVREFIKTVENLKSQIASGRMPAAAGGSGEHQASVGGTVKAIYDTISADMKDMADDTVLLIASKSGEMNNIVPAILKVLLLDKKQNGVYIAVSSPNEQIAKILEENEVSADNLVFIDCISNMSGKANKSEGNTVFVENPSSLEEIGMYTDKVLARLPEPKFVVLDSVSSLLIYNNDRAVKEFIHFMINKMRLDRIGGVILTAEKKEADELIRTIVPMVDKKFSV